MRDRIEAVMLRCASQLSSGMVCRSSTCCGCKSVTGAFHVLPYDNSSIALSHSVRRC